MSDHAELRLSAYTLLLLLAAVASLFASIRVLPLAPSLILLALAAVAMFAELLTVEMSSVTLSIAFSVSVATILLYGPTAGGVVAGLSALPAALVVKEQPLIRGTFNVSQLALAGLAGGWAYLAAGGRAIIGSPFTPGEAPGVIIPLALLACVSFLVNTTLVGLFVQLRLGIPFATVWKSSFAWTIPTQAALTVLALALAQIVASQGVVGLGLFIVPLMISRQFYERYVILKRTYADTVRSLVAVIEAKDAYTRGHSERVAAYSVDIARRLGLSDQRIERLELAALLHDLGKVGISRGILLKDSKLTESEFEVIKAHPEIGANIISEVPFLADLAPFISSHHERVDGTGYGSQLEGEAIPIEARVLGVADAFDAMTSSRPYRSAMGRQHTVRELRRCAGGQFDQVIVETFLEALDSGAFPADSAAGAADEAV